MLHKYKYFVVYEEIDNSLRSLNNDSSIVHIKMKNIISKGIKRSMEVDFYKLMDFKYKQKKDMPEAWNIIIGDVDKFLVDFLKNFGIDMDLLYTTNVGVLNIRSQNESSILWDVSYWAIYIKYLEFVFWMENEPGFSSKQTLQPLAMKKNVLQGRAKEQAIVLSGGEKQRIGIARAILKNASVIYADEPTASLDSANRQIVINLFEECASNGAIVILATHDERLANKCNKVINLNKNREII